MKMTNPTHCLILLLLMDTEPECPDREVYSFSGSACPATCADPDAPSRCSQSSRRGCVCADNFVRKGDACVAPDDCGCLDEGGNEVMVGIGQCFEMSYGHFSTHYMINEIYDLLN